jgi:hypothetical protein
MDFSLNNLFIISILTVMITVNGIIVIKIKRQRYIVNRISNVAYERNVLHRQFSFDSVVFDDDEQSRPLTIK